MIQASQGDLTIEDHTALPGTFDLDGNDGDGFGAVLAINGSIIFRGVSDEPYGGDMQIGEGKAIRLEESLVAGGVGGNFRLARNGTLKMEGGLTRDEAAVFFAAHHADLRGEVQVTGTAAIGAESISTVERTEIAPGTTINFNATDSTLFLSANTI
jgi:hypothetical protein